MDRAPQPPTLAGHLPGLDGVRGLAVLMVMAVHFVGGMSAHTPAQRLIVKAANFGALGVDLFFVLSGFLITGLLVDAKGRPHYFRNFYARRTLRIFPLYYGVLAVLFLVLPLRFPLTPLLERARDHQVWLWTYTTNIYVAAMASWDSLTYVTHFWSLAIEEHFYLVWPLLVFALRRESLERLCVAVLGGGLALRIVASLCGVSELSIQVLTPCRVDTLCFGGLLALIARREGGFAALSRRSGPSILILSVAIFALSAWCAVLKLGLPVLHPVRSTLYTVFFGALSISSLERNAVGRFFSSPVLGFFGKYSYGLYVYHGLLTWYMAEMQTERRLDAMYGNHWVTIACNATIGLGVSVAAAVLSYHLFEKRFLLLKRLFETAPLPVDLGNVVVTPPSGAATASRSHIV